MLGKLSVNYKIDAASAAARSSKSESNTHESVETSSTPPPERFEAHLPVPTFAIPIQGRWMCYKLLAIDPEYCEVLK
jgi:hypothetical protein